MWDELEEAFIDAYLSAADKHIKERMAEIRAMETPVYLTEEQREQYRRDAIRAPFRAAIAATPAPNVIARDALVKWLDAEIAAFTEPPELSIYEQGYRAAVRHTRTHILAIAPDSREVGE